MTQNIEQRTLVATTTLESSAKTVDEIAHKDTEVATPVGNRKSFPKISREWDEKSTELKTQWENDSATLRQDWQNERNELSTKALGVKPWESGVSESNINQQRRWTDNHTYLPKTVPAVMAAEGPDDNWVPYTADKSGTLHDVFGRKPVDLVAGVTLIPDTNLSYPKIAAFGKLWELRNDDQQLTVSAFSETQDGYLVLTLNDASQVVANKVEGASRKFVYDEKKKQTSMFMGQHDFIVGTVLSLIGQIIRSETAIQVNDHPAKGKDSIYEIFPQPTSGMTIDGINLLTMTITLSGSVFYLRDLTKPSSDPVSWGADPEGLIESSMYFKRAALAGVPLKRNSGVFLLEAEEDPFHLHPDSDLSGCEFVCPTVELGETHARKRYICQISQDAIDVTSEFDVTEMVQGQTALTNPNKREGFLYFTSDKIQMFRNNDGVLSPVYRKEANMINKEGALSYAMYLVFYTTSTKVIFKPYLDSAKCKLPKITVKGKIRSPVKCSRNNTQVQVAVIDVELVDGILTPIERVECCNVTVSQLTFPKSGQVDQNVVAYPAVHNGCCALVYEGLTTITGWGGIDGNYTRDILIKDSHVKKVSGHAFCSDIKTINSTVYDRGAIHGYGYYQIYDSRISHRGKGFTAIVETRQDFMSSWDGPISIKRCQLDVEGAIDEIRFVQSLPPTYTDMPEGENHIPAYEPTVQIDDLTININVPVVDKYKVTGLYLGGSEAPSENLRMKYLPRDKNYINNITVNSKSKILFKPITNTRDYSTQNVYALSLHDKLEYEFKNWSASRYYTQDNLYDSGLFGVDTYTFGSSRIPQSYFISHCDWVSVLQRTPNKVEVTIFGGKSLGVRASSWKYQPTSDVKDSLVIYSGNVHLVDPETDVGGATVRMPIHCDSVSFQHGSYFHNGIPVSDVYLGRSGFYSQVVYMSRNCCIRKSLNATEKSKQEFIDLVTNSFKHPEYFDA
ncbi:hypothetical protein ACWONT_001948 [Vibrio parahaemolyticus]